MLRSLAQVGAIPTPLLSVMNEDGTPGLEAARRQLASALGVPTVGQEDARVLRETGLLVMRRSARLAAAGVCAVLRRMGRDAPDSPPSLVAIDGGLYRGSGLYRQWMREAVAEVLGSDAAALKVQLELVEDGSGVGAAITAALASSR